jgi:transposase
MGRDALRRYAWAPRGERAIVDLPFARGERVSVVAALDTTGFLGWDFTAGTFDRAAFHKVMMAKIIPYLSPWPLPRSILVLDNARIHMYKELEDAIHAKGALLFYLPPYSPQLNPIEVGFAQLKKYIQRYPLAFRFNIKATLNVAMRRCIRAETRTGVNLFHHCGYDSQSLIREKFYTTSICLDE